MSISASTLEDIHENALTGLTVGNAPIGMSALKQLADALAVNTSLTNLNLENHNIGDEGAAYIADALHKNSTLREINLRNNAIGPKGAALLAEAVAGHPTLGTLNIGRNKLGDEGVEALTPALNKGVALRYLSVDENHITAAGAQRIAQNLREGSDLKSLNISRNGMKPEGCLSLAESLRENTSLVSLSIHGNTTDDESVREISSTLRKSGNVNLLHLTLVKVNDELQQMLKRNMDTAKDLAHAFQWNKPNLSADDYRQINRRIPVISHVLDVETHELEARFGQMVAQLPQLPEKSELPDGLFKAGSKGYAPLDNPRLWDSPEAAKATLDGVPLTRELLAAKTKHGGTMLEALANALPAAELIGELNKRGVKLGASELLNSDNKPNPLMTALLEQKDGAVALFSLSNWLNQPVQELRRVHAALPEGSPNIALHALQQAISHEKKHVGLGR